MLSCYPRVDAHLVSRRARIDCGLPCCTTSMCRVTSHTTACVACIALTLYVNTHTQVCACACRLLRPAAGVPAGMPQGEQRRPPVQVYHNGKHARTPQRARLGGPQQQQVLRSDRAGGVLHMVGSRAPTHTQIVRGPRCTVLLCPVRGTDVVLCWCQDNRTAMLVAPLAAAAALCSTPRA